MRIVFASARQHRDYKTRLFWTGEINDVPFGELGPPPPDIAEHFRAMFDALADELRVPANVIEGSFNPVFVGTPRSANNSFDALWREATAGRMGEPYD